MGKRRVLTFIFVAFAILAIVVAFGWRRPRSGDALTTTASIDLPRYMGAWWVIANIPYFGENGNVASRDVYKLDADGNVDTTYVYRKAFDAPEKTLGSLGIVQAGNNNAYWIVRLFWVIRADYLVLEAAPDYSWALIGQPSRDLGWVLARDPAMDAALYTSLLQKFRGYGYAAERVRRVAQFKEQLGQPGFQ